MPMHSHLNDVAVMSARELWLRRESRVGDLLPAGAPDRLEASGVLAADGRFYVVCDNLRSVAVIDQDLARAGTNTMVPTRDGDQGYEDIARDPVTGHRYLLIEAARRDDDYMARVEEYDDGWRFVSAGWLEVALPSSNKGVEGLECVRRDDTTYLLGLCEGNRNRGGKAGRRPGGGRILVFRRGSRNWKHDATVDLPEDLPFTDYSGMSIMDGRVAVTSQESSALWIGNLEPGAWTVTGPGSTYLFPRDANDDIVYCTVEGVCWLGSDEVAVVSDRAKSQTQPHRCQAKDQSLHIFTIPGNAA
jgi:hypothetical protein